MLFLSHPVYPDVIKNNISNKHNHSLGSLLIFPSRTAPGHQSLATGIEFGIGADVVPRIVMFGIFYEMFSGHFLVGEGDEIHQIRVPWHPSCGISLADAHSYKV